MDSLFHEEKHITEKCGSAIIITGIMRSGTTALGEVIHSMKGVEYTFEPPMLFALFPLIHSMQEKFWRMLYQLYLYEEFLIDALAGRNLNFNTHDDSCIYNAKSREEIEERLSKSWRKVELEEVAKASTIAFKMPDMVAYLPKFLSYFPNARIIILNRSANDAFHSLKKKGWFTDTALKFENRLWPTNEYQGFRIPHFIPKDDLPKFVAMNEIERIAHYYLTIHEGAKHVHGATILSYDAWIKDPVTITKQLAEKFRLEFGTKTDFLLAEVARRGALEKTSKEDLLALLDEETRAKVLSLSEGTTL